MVEVDPAILVAGSTAIAALMGVVVCMSSGGSNSNNSDSGKSKKESSSSPAPKKEAKAATKAKKNKEKKPEKKEEKKVEKKEPVAPVSKKKAAKVVEEKEPPAPEVVPVVVEESKPSKKAKETPEQRAARLERQKIAKQKKSEEAAAALAKKEPVPVAPKVVPEVPVQSQQSQISDGWAVVEDRRKKKPKPVEVKIAANVSEDDLTAQATSSVVTEQVMVDSKKIGGIIGPKGVTLHAIQDMTEVKIDTPKDRDGSAQVAVTVSGSAEGVVAAVKIIKELNTKGYSKALEGDNFNESAISVKYSYLSELIGKNGCCIRAMQDKTGVKISIPPNNDAKTKVRIGLAGTPEGIIEVKTIIGEIMTYFHSEVTHPGVIHQTMDVPERMYNMIIGSRGAEIKHIQNNFKVSVHIPNAESTIKDVLIVGQKAGVDGAIKYIEKIVSNLTQEEAKAESIAETWNEQQATAEETTGDEPWMDQYSYNREKKVSLISKDGADVLQKAQATAWKDSTSADGW
jgi:predicted RNA-binding protein YlqC (UPF0109 family)